MLNRPQGNPSALPFMLFFGGEKGGPHPLPQPTNLSSSLSPPHLLPPARATYTFADRVQKFKAAVVMTEEVPLEMWSSFFKREGHLLTLGETFFCLKSTPALSRSLPTENEEMEISGSGYKLTVSFLERGWEGNKEADWD